MNATLSCSVLLAEKAGVLAPAVVDRLSAASRSAPRADAGQAVLAHLSFLRTALAFGRNEIFDDYVRWVDVLVRHRGVRRADLLAELQATRAEVMAQLPPPQAGTAADVLAGAMRVLGDLPSRRSLPAPRLLPLAQALLLRLLDSDLDGAAALVDRAQDARATMDHLYLDVFAPVLHEVGRLWQLNEITTAQEHFCAASVQWLMSTVHRPRREHGVRRPTAVCAAVTGELHDLGARMVADLLAHAGWNAIFLGASTPPSDLLRMALDHRAQLLAISCTHAPNVQEVASLITAVRALPECEGLTVMVGGHAFNRCPGLWRDVGADAWAADGREAVARAQALL